MLARMRKKKNANSERRAPIDKQVAFKEFKLTEEALETEQKIIGCRAQLKAKRGDLKTKTENVNQIKHQIDEVKGYLDLRNDQKTRDALTKSLSPGFTSHTDGFDHDPVDQGEVIDEEELERIRALKDLKKEYR